MSSLIGKVSAVLAGGAIALAASAGTGQAFVETFDSLPTEGLWTWGAGDFIDPNGGNPGGCLATNTLATFAPTARTRDQNPHQFSGDFRARGVTKFSIDLITHAATFGAGGRPCTLMLVYDNGTPMDFSDDSAAYFLGPNVPLPGEGWITYEYDIPSQETELPSEWALINLGNIDDPAIHSWDEIIQNVSSIRMHYGHPEFFFLLQDWQLGMDNASITVGGDEPVVVYETNDPFGSIFGVNGFDVYENQSVAVRFAPNGDFDLHSVGLWLWNNDEFNPRPITISLRPDFQDSKIGSIPSDEIIETWEFIVPVEGQFNPQLYTFTSELTPRLNDGVHYWLVAESDTQAEMDPVWAWAANDSGDSTVTNFFTGEWQPVGHGAVPATMITGFEAQGLPADLNGDGHVNGTDLAALLAQWGTDGAADFNNSGAVDGADLAFLLANWAP